jgi:hypothetical protein
MTTNHRSVWETETFANDHGIAAAIRDTYRRIHGGEIDLDDDELVAEFEMNDSNIAATVEALIQ